MKWQPRQLEQAVKAAQPLPPLILIYGDDGGHVARLKKQVVVAVLSDPDDPFASDTISAEDLIEEPGKLLEAATTIGFGAGTRLVRLDNADGDGGAKPLNALTSAVEYCLEEPLQDVVVLIGVPRLDKGHKLVKAVEKHKTAAVVRCFSDNARDLTTLVDQTIKAAGKTIRPEARTFLTDNLGNDRAVSEQELTKLLLYAGDKSEVTLEDCLAIVASAPSVNVFKLCDAIGNRDRKQVDQLLTALNEEGEDLARASALVLRHLRRLQACRELMAAGQSVDAAMGALKPPVLFDKPAFARQAQNYPDARLKTLAEKFYQLQEDARSGLIDGNLAAGRMLLSLGA